MYTKYISIILALVFLLVLFLLLVCDNYNIVEPRFFSKNLIQDIPICEAYEDTTSVQDKLTNIAIKEWQNYNVITKIEAVPKYFRYHDMTDSVDYDFMMIYTIKNIDTVSLNYQMNLRPPVVFRMDSVIFNNLAIYDTLEWTLTLEPDEEYTELIDIVIKEANEKEPKFHLNALLVGCISPAFAFPMDLDFEYASVKIIEQIPIEYGIYLCWKDNNKDTLYIELTLPEQTRVKLNIFNWNGSIARELFHGFTEAGTYSIIWNLKNENGIKCEKGLYVLSLQANSFKKLIGFEIN